MESLTGVTDFYLICDRFASHMRYVCILYALRFYLICVTILSHMRYDSISYALRLYLICDRFVYYMLQFSVLYATVFCTICHSFLYYMLQVSVLYATGFCTICHRFLYYMPEKPVQHVLSSHILSGVVCNTTRLLIFGNKTYVFYLPLPPLISLYLPFFPFDTALSYTRYLSFGHSGTYIISPLSSS